jgi:hypothetical protein
MIKPTAVLLCFIPFAAIADEISDSVYLMANWDTFSNDFLRWACFTFFWGPLIVHFLFAGFLYYGLEKGPYFRAAGLK